MTFNGTHIIPGKWYKWVGPTKRPSWFHSAGRMDFILDGQPHLCLRSEINNIDNTPGGLDPDGYQADFSGDMWWWQLNGTDWLVECNPTIIGNQYLLDFD